MTEIKHRTIKTNGINMHIAEAGEGPLVLMLHGFPELWYSYRHQIPALAEAGYHAVAPDIRGYGQSDAPQPIEAYAMKEHLADALGILDALGAETAVVVGHDWGAPMAWNSAVLHPERYRAVVGLSVPFLQRSPAPPMQLFKQVFQDNFFYMLYFQEPGVAEKELQGGPTHARCGPSCTRRPATTRGRAVAWLARRRGRVPQWHVQSRDAPVLGHRGGRRLLTRTSSRGRASAAD